MSSKWTNLGPVLGANAHFTMHIQQISNNEDIGDEMLPQFRQAHWDQASGFFGMAAEA